MNTVFKLKAFLLLWFGLWQMGFAASPLYIEISGGQVTGLPVGILPFNVIAPKTSGLLDIAKVIRQDLHNSGQFKPYPISQMEQLPKSAQEVDFAYWQNLGLENVLLGSVEQTGQNKFRITFELYDVFKSTQENTAAQHTAAPLLAMQFYDITPDRFRSLAHHVSDLVFEKILGVKGVFSTRIAYVSERPGKRRGRLFSLHVSDSDGHNQKTIQHSSQPLMSPSWSPDGKKIAYVSFVGDHASIQVVELNTGKVERVSHFPGINGAPAWSPAGDKLAVVLSKDGSPHIYVLDLKTRALKQATFGTAIDTEPTWLPDGRGLLFTSNRGGKPQIYKVNLLNNKVTRLTFKGNYNAKASITPDAKKLIMMHRTKKGLFNIAVQSLATGELRLLTRAAADESPCLAPNGMMVLYGSKEAGQGVLGVVSVDGRFRMRLPSPVPNVREPAWSPLLF